MSTTRPPGPLRALLGAWRVLGTDPLRLLVASGAALLVDLATVLGLLAWWAEPGPHVWWALPAAWAARCAAVGLLRAAILAWGDAALGGIGVDPWHRGLAAVIVELVTGMLVALAAGAALLPFGGLAAAVAVQGVVPGALVLLALAWMTAWSAGLVVRAALATALPRAVVGRQGAVHALAGAVSDARRTFGFALGVLVVGDALRLFGSLLLVAGALPVYPLPLLALLHRAPVPQPAPGRPR